MMNNNITGRIVISVCLIGIGLLALLANLGTIHIPLTISGGGIIWLVLFVLCGIIFLGVYMKGSDNWWAVIPGLTLIGLGTILSDLFPKEIQYISVAVLFTLLGLGFLVAYASHREYWGLIFPGGALLTAAAHTMLTQSNYREYGGALLWIGLGISVMFVYWAAPIGRAWFLFAALACGFLAIVSGAEVMLGTSLLLPALLILFGSVIIWRAFRKPSLG